MSTLWVGTKGGAARWTGRDFERVPGNALPAAAVNGMTPEGDGITPLGVFDLREVFYRADRILKPRLALALRAIEKDDGWCDAPDDPNYNRLVKLPYPASAETLWREDHLYDLVAVMGFNDDPVVAGRGSAIFLHLARPDYLPTAGCVALAHADLVAALEQFRPGDKIRLDLLPGGRAELKADQGKGSWQELSGMLKGKTNGARLSIEDINDAIAGAGASSGMRGIERK